MPTTHKRHNAWRPVMILTVAQLLLAIAAFFGLGSYMEKTLARDPLDVELTLISLHALGLSLIIGVAYAKYSQEQESTHEEIRRAIQSTAEVMLLRENDFHERFLRDVAAATSRVAITNLDPKGRYFATDEIKFKYLRDLVKLIKTKKQMPFRRLERFSSQNRQWLRDLTQMLQGCSNASVACLEDCGDDELGLALSVQVVDGSVAYLVAITEHYRTGEFRDVAVLDAGFAKMAELYYNRLWEKATVLLDKGELTEAGMKLLKE